MTPATDHLKRSAKSLHKAAVNGGWTVNDVYVEHGARTVVYERNIDDPAVATIREKSGGRHFRRNAALFADRAEVMTDAETGAYILVNFYGDDGERLPHDLNTVTDVAVALGELDRAVKAHYHRIEAERTARLVREERAAVRAAYLDDLADDYRYRSVKAIAESETDPPEFDLEGNRGTYWAASRMKTYLTAIVKKRMAAAALDMVGWPVDGSDTPGDVGTPMPLGTALAKAVADVLARESSSSTDYEALTVAAKDILRIA